MDKKLDIIKDEIEKKLVFHTQQQVGNTIDYNRIDRNAGPQDLSFGRKIASIPTAVLDAWIQEGVDYRLIKKDPAMRKKFYQKLNSREFSAFKTYDGGIGQ